MPLDVRSALICDLVRIEDNGKHIIIGVYTGDISTQIPAKIPLTFWVSLRPSVVQGNMEFEAKLDYSGDKKSKVIAGSVPVENEDEVILVLRFTVQVAEPGPLSLSLRPKGGRWSKIISKKIVPPVPTA